ncbi:MAG: glycosyl transferase family 1 [Bacteroidetes bacterium]|nr:glycosyl transferase family 1 [Rhodothermia bacterium]MCS7155586.1 glycosyl transferase family 1 [Bacteroidota bacterium]MCX7906444.1 glycosyl transferase family 1 [Bacteroidota bacterium]MDW8137274.1 glycosyl transferase family 1 [Bacteroidota bacterium]MDW8284856.1 glycosyl transferase family 1 [Bacteroidota bacterium]
MSAPGLLVLAYYFPPMGLSGVQRTLKFVKYWADFGWRPIVITVEPGGYFAFDETLLEELEGRAVEVRRVPSWDPTRLFGSRTVVQMPERRRARWSRWSQWLFVPDNKIGWLWPAEQEAEALIRQGKVAAIYSTAPPYTAHLVGLRLKRRFPHLPWVADFRDDWVGNPRHVYPTALHRALQERFEAEVLAWSDLVFTINRRIKESLIARYPERRRLDYARIRIVPQGFDPEDFRVAPEARTDERFQLLYTGAFYDRQTPEPFLRALARWLQEHPERRQRIWARFIGLWPAEYTELVERLGLADVAQIEPYRPHREVIAAQRAADVLWLIIGRYPGAEAISTGKLYEYFGSGKPILALLPPEGIAARDLARYGAAEVVDPEDLEGAVQALERLFLAWEAGRLPSPDPRLIAEFDRRRWAERTARWMLELLHVEEQVHPAMRYA